MIGPSYFGSYKLFKRSKLRQARRKCRNSAVKSIQHSWTGRYKKYAQYNFKFTSEWCATRHFVGLMFAKEIFVEMYIMYINKTSFQNCWMKNKFIQTYYYVYMVFAMETCYTGDWYNKIQRKQTYFLFMCGKSILFFRADWGEAGGTGPPESPRGGPGLKIVQFYFYSLQTKKQLLLKLLEYNSK